MLKNVEFGEDSKVNIGTEINIRVKVYVNMMQITIQLDFCDQKFLIIIGIFMWQENNICRREIRKKLFRCLPAK